jgi:hypothetical protein
MKATNCLFFRFFVKEDARYASDSKSPVRKIRTPGSVAGLVSNRQSYADCNIIKLF